MDAQSLRRIVKSAALALACGAALALSFPRPGFWPLGWIALAPLFALWTNQNPKEAALGGLAAGFGFHGLALYWIFSTCRFAGLPIPLCALAWAALALFLALDWAIIAGAGAWLMRRAAEPLKPWLWAALWSAVAFAAQRWTPRFNADFLAYTQSGNLAMIQMDSAFGPEGLGFLVAAFNAALGLALWRGRRKPARTLLPRSHAINLAAAACLASAAWVWGAAQLAKAPRLGPAGSDKAGIAVELLQPNVDQYQKWDQNFVQSIWADIETSLSLPRARAPQLIVWPESSIPRWVPEGQSIPEAAAVSRKLGAWQIVGAATTGPDGDFNSAVLIKPDGSFGGVYHKRELVPFGEYVPLPFLRRWIGILDQMGDLTPGRPDQALLATPLGPTGVTVCYEMVFPRLTRSDAAHGARAVVNVNDDGWYKDTWGPYQHFMASRFRAVENRVYVLRAANTGISGVVDPWGRIVAELPLNVRGRLDALIPKADPFPKRSFYARHGDWFGALCLILTLAWAAWTIME